MDTRRHLTVILGLASLALLDPAAAQAPAGVMAPVPNPAPRVSGPVAIATANRQARATSKSADFRDSLQVFDYAPGRVYEVWTAPLRVTTLSLAPGETILTLAAGDTLRWQIAEAASGEGAARQVHVLIKPLVRGLETNLVLATSARVYLLALRSGQASAYNTAIAWSTPPAPVPAAPLPTPTSAAEPRPERLDSDFRVQVRGARTSWTPVAVMSDGRRTLIVFPPGLTQVEAPALFAISAEGAPELVNYRLAGDVLVVDRVLERAELRAPGAKRGAVQISRLGSRS